MKISISASALAKGFAMMVVMILAACGDETTNVTRTGVITEISKGDAFPDCDSAAVGEMLYAADSGRVFLCADGAWQTLDGVDGKDGEDSEKGSSDTIVVSETDTVFFSKVDTIVSWDTLALKDTLYFKDTLVIFDTIPELEGASCTAEALLDGSGYKIVCGGDSVGVVLNGLDGEKGETGDDGATGPTGATGDPGVGCSVSDDGAGTVTVTCASGTITLYKALCGTEPYDPEKKFCDSRDGQTYKWVVIGTQTWMAENLNFAYNQGTAASYCYGNSADSCAKYGRLYTWAAAMDSAAVYSTNGQGCGYGVECSPSGTIRGVCPAGFHLPTDAEWTTLTSFVEDDNGDEWDVTSLKATSGWQSYSGIPKGTDRYGFTLLAAGYRSTAGASLGIGSYTYLWSSSEAFSEGDTRAKYRSLHYYNNFFEGGGSSSGYYKDIGAYIRCLKD